MFMYTSIDGTLTVYNEQARKQNGAQDHLSALIPCVFMKLAEITSSNIVPTSTPSLLIHYYGLAV